MTSAELIGVSYSKDVTNPHTDALCAVRLRYKSGNVLVSTPSFALSSNDGTWTIDKQYRTHTTAPLPARTTEGS